MLPVSLQKDIIEIKNLFNNYEYMKKNKEQLKKIKQSIISIIKKLDYYKNEPMVDWTFKRKNYIENPGQLLYSKPFIEAIKFLNDCNHVKSKFNNYLNKLNTRLNKLEIDKIDYNDKKNIEFYNDIFFHIINNNIDMLEKLLNENFIDLNYVVQFNNQNQPPVKPLLVVACEKNRLDIVKMLYNNNANININLDFETNFVLGPVPLLKAITAKNHNIELIRYLLDNGAKVNFISSLDETPLNKAMKDLLLYKEMIIKYQANVNFHYQEGSILHYACDKRNIECIKVLLENSANVNITNSEGNTPLHCLIKTLFKYEIDDIKKIIQLFIKYGYAINFQNNFGNTILHQATKKLISLDIIKYLLSKGAKCNITNNDGNTPLHLFFAQLEMSFLMQLITKSTSNNEHNITKKLLENVIDNIKTIVDLSIKNGFNINSQNHLGNTILHYCFIKLGDISIIKYLLNHGALVNIKNNNKETVLDIAKKSENKELVKIINNI